MSGQLEKHGKNIQAWQAIHTKIGRHECPTTLQASGIPQMTQNEKKVWRHQKSTDHDSKTLVLGKEATGCSSSTSPWAICPPPQA
jgi:hypothetical protein